MKPRKIYKKIQSSVPMAFQCDPERFAKWTVSNPCDCGIENYTTCSIEWTTVQLTNRVFEGIWDGFRGVAAILTVGLSNRVGGGLKDATHEYVLARFRCKVCKAEFFRSYEIYLTKYASWGYYEQYRDKRATSQATISFELIENYFAQMWDKYDLIRRNCSHWSRDFYKMIVQTSDDE
ncbi:hypothetical protein Ddc_10972 [Ditylenchus destructor]|nr:hypothetical protein Ddc_10972 [Ditylenchus destructor]